MLRYAMLRNSGHNQVYFKVSGELSLHELCLLNLPIYEVKLEEIANLSYLTFGVESSLRESELEKISRLSSVYGLFQVEEGLLRPVVLPDSQILDRSLGTILKYQGKTNEIFTRMILNLGLSQVDLPLNQVKLLDPVAGRGTTLFEAVSLGVDAYGVELQEKSVGDGVGHLKKFLEQGKIKHKTNAIKVSGPNKSFTAKRHTVDFTVENEPYHFEMVQGDSKFCKELFPSQYFHLLIGDLPYGIQHGNEAGGKHRSPAQLLSTCLGGWHKVLKKEGILVLSWNALILSREKMVEQLGRQNFQVLSDEHWDNLAHKVDNSILRDVVVCKKM